MADTFLEDVAFVPNNTYNYSNSSVFYSLVNYSFKNYYTTVIQKSQQWLDGYDPSFHKANKGIFSSRIGAKITAGITKQIFGRGLVFVKGNNTLKNDGLDFISHKWQDKTNFQNVVKTLIGYTTPLGTSLLKVNTKWNWNSEEERKKQELWVQALRIDYFYYSVDSENQLSDVTCFIRAFQTTEDSSDSYCLVEKRFYKDEHDKFVKDVNGQSIEFEDKTHTVRKPYVVYKIFKINATSNNNTLAANKGHGEDFKTLPDAIKRQLKEEYGALMIDKEIRLPFTNLGCYLFLNEGGDFTHPSMPFGRPLMFDCLTDFMEYDMERSFAIRDLYNSKGIVGLPKGLVQSSIVPGTGGNLAQVQSPFGQLEIPGYEFIDGLDPNTQKPIVSQFEIRAQEHEIKQNAILKSIATTIGMSPRVIASYLVQGNEKTAEQTHSEDDTITEWIKSHRQDYIYGLNQVIEDVLSFYGIVDNVEVRFASDGLVSNERQLEIIGKKLDLGLIDLEDAVRELYPDLDEIQLQEKIAKAQKQKAENEQAQQKQFDEMYGDNLDGNQENEFDQE